MIFLLFKRLMLAQFSIIFLLLSPQVKSESVIVDSLFNAFDINLEMRGISNLIVQDDDKILAFGSFITASGLARLNTDSTVDTTFSSEARGPLFSLVGDKIVVFGLDQGVSRINVNDGSLDSSFNSPFNNNGLPIYYGMAVQQDGKILLTGNGDMSVNGEPSDGRDRHRRLIRLNTDGTQDTGFLTTTLGLPRSMIAVQNDQKILFCAAQNVDFVNGERVGRLVRFNHDGSLDLTFKPNINFRTGEHAKSMLELSDGKILIRGKFGNYSESSSEETVLRLNADGTIDTEFNIITFYKISELVVGSDGKILIGGEMSFRSNAIARYNKDGSFDNSFAVSIADGNVESIALLSDGKILMSGRFDNVDDTRTPAIVRLNRNGGVDNNFTPTRPGFVRALAVQANGKILMAGKFLSVGGSNRSNFARLNASGSLDPDFEVPEFRGTIEVDYLYRPAFAPFVAGGAIFSLALQRDEKILIGGTFSSVNGGRNKRSGFARLNPNGTLDGVLNSDATVNSAFEVFPQGGDVYSIAVQDNGDILLGGSFLSVGASDTLQIPRNGIAKVNSLGEVDVVFDPSVNGIVYSITMQNDGSILLGGDFDTVDGFQTNGVARVNAGGDLDVSFSPNIDGKVTSLAVQTDGKIIIGGDFVSVGGFARNNIARVNADGSLDVTFDPDADGSVNALAIQSDGRVVIGGDFASVGGVASVGIARLNLDGSGDTTFEIQADGDVKSLALQKNGKIIMGGEFTKVAGASRTGLARLRDVNPPSTNNFCMPVKTKNGKTAQICL
jgi:uncharacterized delta-60 repeat protein